jgi:hypothetical protein
VADVVTTAIYKLSVQGTSDIQKADAAIAALSNTQDKAVASAAQLASSNVTLTKTEETVSTVKRTSTDQLDRWIGSMDKATRATQVYQASLARIARYEEDGVADAGKLATATQLVTDRYNAQIASINKLSTAANENAKIAQVHGNALKGVGEAAKLSYTDIEILRSGVINTVQSMAAGVGAAKTLETQFFQTAPAILPLIKSLSGLQIAAGLAGVALVAAGAAIVGLGVHVAAEDARIRGFNTTLAGMGQTSLATGAQLEASVRALKEYGLSADEAAKAIRAMSVAGINPAFAQQIGRIGANLGAITGAGSAAGIAQITEAIKGGLEPTIELAMNFQKLSAKEAENFEQMGRNGQGMKALSQLTQLLDQRTKGLYTGSLSEFQKATNNLSKAWDTFMDQLGKEIAPNLQKFFEDLTGVVNALTTALQFLKTMRTSGGGQAGEVIPLVPQGTTGTTKGQIDTTGTGAAGRVSMAPGVVTAPGVEQLKSILGAASVILPAGQNFEIFSGVGSRSGSSLHPGGGAADYRVVNTATGQPIDTGVVGRPQMGGGLPTPDMERAVLRAAMAAGVPVSIGSLFGNPDPGHIGIGQNAEVAGNQAKQAAFLAAGGGAAGAAGGDVKPDDLQKSAKALADLTRARQNDLEVTKAEGVQANILRAGQQAYDDALARGLSPQDAATNRTAAMANEAAKGAAEWDKVTTATDRATLATRDITEAYKQGGLAVVEATAATQARADVLAHEGTLIGKEAQVEERRVQLLTQAAQQEKLTNAQDMQSQRDTQESIQKEISLQGQSSDVITEQLTLLKAKQEIDEKFPLLSEKEKDARLAAVKATADMNAQLAEAQRNQQRINDTLTSIGQTIDSSITQNIEAALSGQKITSWHTIFKNVLVQIEGQLLSLSVIKPAIGSVLGFLGFGGAAQSFGSLFSGAGILNPSGGGIFSGSTGTAGVTGGAQIVDSSGNVLGTISNAGSLLSSGSNLFGGGGGLFGGSGGIGGFINNNIGTSLGFAPTGLLPGSGAGAGIFTNAATGATSDIAGSGVAGGLFGGTTLTSALGGVAAGATAGSLLNSLLGPSIGGGKTLGGTIGSTGGALAGAIIGSIIPGIGTLIGGLVGGSAGGLLGGLFGAGKPNNASAGSVNLATGQLGAFSSGGVAANDATSQAVLQPIGAALSQLTNILGTSITPMATAIVQAGSRDGIKVVLRSGEGTQQFTGADAGAVTQQIAQWLFEHEDLSGLGGTLGKIVSTLNIDQLQSADALNQAVAFSKAYDQIKTAADTAFASVESGAQVAGPFEQAMTQISDLFAQMTDQATQYGLSLDPINAALDEATKRLNQDFAKAVNAAFNTSAGNDFLNGIQSIIDNYNSMSREASAIGAPSSIHDTLGQTYDNQLKTVFSQLTSSQLNQVIAQFGDLTNDLPALATTARDAAAATEALNAQLAQQTQIYQNQQNAYTAAGQGFLAQLRDLDQTRIAAQAANASVGLGADQNAIVQETEHQAALNILMGLTTDQMEQAREVLAKLNPAFASWVDEAEAAVTATNNAADASARAAQLLQAQATIQQYLNQLQTQASVFTSPKSRLDAAQQQYNTTLTAAQGGDLTALQNITTAAQTLLQSVSDYYASSQPGQVIFKQVQDQLTALLGSSTGTGPAKTTDDVVNAINDTGKDTTTTITATSASLIQAGIDASKAITDNAASMSNGVITAANTANSNLMNTTLATGKDIVNSALSSAASITGTTAQVIGDQTVTLETATAQVATASVGTTAAVVASGTDITASTKAIFDNNVANSASLISNNSTNAASLISATSSNAATISAAGAANTVAIIDQNNAGATAIIQNTSDKTASLITAEDAHTASLVAKAQATTDQAVGSANTNTNAIITQNSAGFQSSIAAYNAGADKIVQAGAATGAWGKATVDTINAAIGWLGSVNNDQANSIIATIAAWGNANINTANAWGNAFGNAFSGWFGGLYQTVADWSSAVVRQVAAASDAIVGSAGWWSNALNGTIAGGSNSVVAMVAATGNNDVAAIYGAANGIVSTVAAYENATRASVDSTNSNLAGWLNNVYNAVNGASNNDVSWNQNLYNKLQEILNNLVGWNQNLWNELHVIHQYIQLLTEVTINFDEWMAGASGAQLDAMNSIQNSLRRQAFG